MPILAGQVVEVQVGDDTQLVHLLADETSHLRVVNGRGRQQRLPRKRLLWVHEGAPAAGEVGERLGQLERDAESLADMVDVELLYETVVSEPRGYSASQLAAIYFDDESPLHCSAIWRAMRKEGIHFRRNGARWEPRPAETVADLLRRQAVTEEREAERRRQSAWLADVLQSDGPVTAPEEMEPVLDALQSFLRGRCDTAAKLLAEAAPHTPHKDAAFLILQRTGRVSADADPFIVKAGLQLEFPEDVLEAVAALQPFTADSAVAEAQVAIDDASTREVDDAVSVEPLKDGWRLHVDIADVARMVGREDALDRIAAKRGATIYLPTTPVLMLPERVSCHLASLAEGDVRPVLRFTAEIDSKGEVRNPGLTPVAVHLARRMTYEQVDAALAADEDANLSSLHAAAEALRARRAQAGALMFSRSECKVCVTGDEIEVKIIDCDTPARRLVSECMILANSLAARWAREQGASILYRGQDAPAGALPPSDTGDPATIARICTRLPPARWSTLPHRHFGLGLEEYTQTTSPLRRYADLVMLRQLSAQAIGDSPPYTTDEMMAVMATAESSERQARNLEQRATRFWLLEHLRREHLGDRVRVRVTRRDRGGCRVVVEPWQCAGFLAGPADLQPEDCVEAVIADVVPDKGRLRLTPADH